MLILGGMMKTLGCLTLLLAALISPAFAAGPTSNASTSIATHGETRVAGTFGNTRLVANFLTHEVNIGPASKLPPKRRTLNCTYSHTPCSLVDSLEIAVGTHAILLPRSTFGDLSDVLHAQFRQSGHNRYVLAIDGGDASEGYRLELLFDANRVLMRTFIDGEAGEVSERTKYFDLSKSFVDR